MASLLDLIDLREARRCKVKLNGEEVGIVKMLTKGNEKFVMIEGGYKLPIDNETYEKLSKKLDEHLRNYIFAK